MRKKTRDDLPNPKAYRHGNYKTAAERKVSNERVDLVANPKLEGRDAALAALARMKELEAKNRRKMHVLRIDHRTTIASNKKANLERMAKAYV